MNKLEKAKQAALNVYLQNPLGELMPFSAGFDAGFACQGEWTAINAEADLPKPGQMVFMSDRETKNRLYGYITRQGKFLTNSTTGNLYFSLNIFEAWYPAPAKYQPDGGEGE